jgi:hypothetical protein
MGIGRAFFFWAVFQEADQVNIFNNGLELKQASGAIGCWAVFHVDHHATSRQAKPTPMAKAVK